MIQESPSVLERQFPRALTESEYVSATAAALAPYGFTRDNAIALYTCCRDEISQSLAVSIDRHWGEPFNGASLAGIPLLGKTGFAAAISHAPTSEDRERYVFYGCPHVGIGPSGEPGVCQREGQAVPSTACGALLALLAQLRSGSVDSRFDSRNTEQSLLIERIATRLPWGSVPDLFELTKLTHDIIVEELEATIALVVDTDKADYALFTGIQLHTPEGDLFDPAVSYAVIGGERHDLQLTEAG